MEKVVLRVRYIESEKELNEFLLNLNVGENSRYPKLQNIVYLPKPEGSGNNDVYDIRTYFTAIVQYFDKVEIKDDKDQE